MGHFVNPDGFVLRLSDELSTWRKTVYEATLDDAESALTYIDNYGGSWRPDRHFFTDMGSVPRLAQVLIPKDRFLEAFLIHDSAYIHGGLWRWSALVQGWRFSYMTRRQADELLYEMCLSSGAWQSTAWAIYLAVRVGGAFCKYGKGDSSYRVTV